MVRIFHHIHVVACEEFSVHNNIAIYLERRKTVPEELLHPAYMYPSYNQISYSTDLCYITRRHKKFSLTSLLRLYHLSHVQADFGICHITLDLNCIYSTALENLHIVGSLTKPRNYTYYVVSFKF